MHLTSEATLKKLPTLLLLTNFVFNRAHSTKVLEPKSCLKLVKPQLNTLKSLIVEHALLDFSDILSTLLVY